MAQRVGGHGGIEGGGGPGGRGLFDMKLTPLYNILSEIKDDNIKFVILATAGNSKNSKPSLVEYFFVEVKYFQHDIVWIGKENIVVTIEIICPPFGVVIP